MLGQAGDVSGKVVVSCTLPMKEDNSELVVAHTSSGAEELARRVPDARLVGAFGTVPSEVLFAVFARRRKRDRPKPRVLRRRPAREESGRDAEPFTLLVAELAYERRGGPQLAYRFERLATA